MNNEYIRNNYDCALLYKSRYSMSQNFVYGIDTASIIKNMNITKMIQQAI